MNARKSSSFIGVITVAVAGTVMTGAVALGHTWGDALISEVVTMLLALGYSVVTSSNSDVGAIYARRADERQHLVVLRASRFAMLAMFAVAFFGAVITVALGEDYWQFDLVEAWAASRTSSVCFRTGPTWKMSRPNGSTSDREERHDWMVEGRRRRGRVRGSRHGDGRIDVEQSEEAQRRPSAPTHFVRASSRLAPKSSDLSQRPGQQLSRWTERKTTS